MIAFLQIQFLSLLYVHLPFEDSTHNPVLIMPFIPHTPESLIPRSDSKNPATTCKGITSNGRPCRRALGTSAQSSPKVNRGSKDGVLALLTSSDDSEGAAAFFCWQHKDQAAALAGVDEKARKSRLVPLKQRTSIDTLVERLGVLEVQDGAAPAKSRHVKPHARPSRKETLPKTWQDVPGPLLSISEDGSPIRARQVKAHKPRRQRKDPSFWSALICCVGLDPGSSIPQKNRPYSTRPEYVKPETVLIPAHIQSSATTPSKHTRRPAPHTPTRKGTTGLPPGVISKPTVPLHRPSLPHDLTSQTQDLLALIPKFLSPQTTSLLLTELAKPVSTHDEEGFIYMFWLTPTTSAAPPADAASSLLPSPARPTAKSRRPSELIQDYASASTNSNPTILLKIGRASNVHRRMNEWTRQCNHHVSLIRFYPYLPTSPSSPSPSYTHPLHYSTSPPTSSTFPTSYTRPSPNLVPSPTTPRKVPHAHKVERLIHLELADKRVKRGCSTCGKEHREWFEVDGTRDGVKGVDEVVRRWVRWGERDGR